MLNNFIKAGTFCTLLSVIFFCNEDGGNSSNVQPEPNRPKISYGTFLISLVVPTEDSEGYTQVQGLIYDGPATLNDGKIWEETARSGNCRLLVPRIPLCVNTCTDGVCVEDDSCQLNPSTVSAGNVTISGLKKNSGETTIIMEPKIYNKYSAIGVAFPPFAEGDLIRFSADGGTAAEAFTLEVQGISPLEVLNDTITLEDNKPVTLTWKAATVAGASTISVVFDISHHGGNYGKIVCECEDNGSLTVDGALLDKLKALGVTGYPRLEMTRKAVSSNQDTKVEVVIESKVIRYLEIPGVVSCPEPGKQGECPAGHSCGEDFQCH